MPGMIHSLGIEAAMDSRLAAALAFQSVMLGGLEDDIKIQMSDCSENERRNLSGVPDRAIGN